MAGNRGMLYRVLGGPLSVVRAKYVTGLPELMEHGMFVHWCAFHRVLNDFVVVVTIVHL